MNKENLITWRDFDKMELRVGTIVNTTEFKEAINPSFLLTIDFGDFGIRQSSAQITTLYNASEIIGKQIVAVTNFPKKQIANKMSECLVLGTLGQENEITLLSTDKPVKNGIKVG